MSKAEYQTMIDNGWCCRKKKLPNVNEEIIFCSESLMTCGIGKLIEVYVTGKDGQQIKNLKWAKYDILGRTTNVYDLKQIEYWRPNSK